MSTNILKVPHLSKFGNFCSLFFRTYTEKAEAKKAVVFLLKSRYLLRKLRQAIYTVLCYYESENILVKIKYTQLSFSEYADLFLKNLFHCFKVSWGWFLWGNRINTPTTLFHGTTTRFLSETMEQGLLPCKTGTCWEEDKYNEFKKVCLTDSLYAAEYFAHVATKKFGGEPIVLRVDVRGMRHMLTIRSETLLERNGGFRVFDSYMEMSSTEPISQDRIRDWYILPKPSMFVRFNWFSSKLKEDVINSVTI